jgi:hypothetical protein
VWEKIGWFAVAYACISLTVTLVMLVVANRALKLGGPIGMARSAGLLVLAVIGLIIWASRKVTGYSPPGETPGDQIRRTVRKTSGWFDGLKDEWDQGKRDDSGRDLPGPRDRR